MGANRWPPVCDTSHARPGATRAACAASGRPRTAQHTSRRPLVHTSRVGSACMRPGARPARARGCRGRGAPQSSPSRSPTSVDLGRRAATRPPALAPACASSTRRGPSCAGWPTGTTHEHEAPARPARAGVQLGPELAVEVRLPGRVAPPRSGLLDDDEEARPRSRAVGARAVVVPLDRARVGGRACRNPSSQGARRARRARRSGRRARTGSCVAAVAAVVLSAVDGSDLAATSETAAASGSASARRPRHVGDDCGGRDAGAVASAVGGRQLDGDAVGGRGPGRACCRRRRARACPRP